MTHAQLMVVLNRQSVRKKFEAYVDVEWDAAENRIEPSDARFELADDCGLGATEWYRAQPPDVRARLGLHVAAQQMRMGIEFESILSRGLLEFAGTHEPGSTELRYAYHEVIEEMQHSLMFQETIARAGLPVRGLEGFDLWGSRRVPPLGRTFPEFFFIHVLGGEAPIDHQQRRDLLRREAMHPLFRRVTQIHVTEEARHISFAKSFLRDRVPRLGAWRLWQLRVYVPFLLAKMAQQMIEPPGWLMDGYGVPDEVRKEARHDPAHQRRLAEGLRPVREICVETGIATRRTAPLWRAFGIWG